MATTTVDELFDRWEAAWSSKDPGAFSAVCDPEVHYEDPLTAEPIEGTEALGAHAQRLWAGFPDARVEKLGVRVASDGFAAAPCKLLATHREPVGGLPATNRFIVVPVIFYCELTADRARLLRVRGFFDLYGAAVQLGVLPGRGTLGEKALLMLRGFGLRANR